MNKINRPIRKITFITMLAASVFYFDSKVHHVPVSDSGEITSCDQSSTAHPRKIQSTRSANNIIDQKNTAAINKIAELEKQIFMQNALIKQIRKNTSMPHPMANVAISQESNEPLAMHNSEEELLNAEQHTETELINELEQRLALEAYDAAWAESLETQLHDIFSDQPQLEGNDLLEVSCRSTLCRIEMDHQDEKSESELISTLAKNTELMSNIDDFYAYRMTDDTDADENAHARLQSVFYIARKGHQLAISEL